MPGPTARRACSRPRGRTARTSRPKAACWCSTTSISPYWERSKKQALANLGGDRRVAVIYANFKAQRDGVLESGFLRFYGTAELYEAGAMREAIFQRLSKREQEHDGADKGIGVLIKIARAADVRGKPLP